MSSRSLIVHLAVACAASVLWADNGTWSAATGGNWSDTANWAAATPATGSTYTATFNTGSGTVNNDLTDLSLKGLQLSGSGFTLAGNTLTLDSAGFITMSGSNNTVNLPLALLGNATLSAASAQTLVVNGAVSGNGGLTIYGGRAVLGNTANSYTGATILVTGILEVASVNALGSSPADPANLSLGDGTFRYTGSSATLSRGFTLAPTNFGGNRALAIDVTNAATTLTVAGKVATPNGSFIKTGEGTLTFTYPGYQEIGKTKPANAESGVITFDANGVADTNSYPTFLVDKGRMILGAAGQTNVIVASSGWVGSKTLASPRLDIIGGVTRFTGGYLTIGRGTGTTASPQRPSMTISGGAYVTIEGSGLVMDNANGLGAAHRCSPSLGITNATLRVFNDCFLSEDGNATSTVIVANNGLFQSDSSSPVGGMKLSASTGAKTDVTFDNGSTGLVYQARLARGSSLTVIGNSVFAMDTTPTNAYQTDLNVGKVLFNGGKLAQRTTSLTSDWFVSLTNVLVGANNMTLDVASQAWLDAPTRADPSNLGGKLIKSGNGTLVIRPTALNVQVNAGRMAYAVEAPQVTNVNNTSTATFAGGSSVELSANGAANGVTLALSGATLNLTPHSLVSNPDLWRYNDRAMRRGDGILQLTPEMGTAGALANQRGSAFLLRKQTVSGAWTATYSYICWATGTDPADGFAFVLQNDPRGLAALGASGANLGYADTTANKITNSIAVGINVTGHQIRFGRQGTLVDTRALPTLLPKLGSSPIKTKFTVSYDGVGLMTVMIDRPGSISYGFTWQVNIAAEVGASDAYLGFSAGTGGRYGQHSITDFLFDNGTATPPSYCRYGGRITLGAETLTTLGNPSTQQRGFVLGTLAYAEQSVLQADASAVPAAPPAPTLADKGMWKLNQFANWKPDGRLAVSTNNYSSPGSAFTTNSYPVTTSWTARFGYDIGNTTVPPADYITFTVQNLTTNNTSHTPTPGFAIMWRYYENGTNTTWVKMYTNGVMVIATNNIAPVSLINGQHANMTVDYNAATKIVTVITSQAGGAFTNFFNGVDMLSAVGSTSAYLGFGAFTGGLYAENIVSDFSFSSAAVAAASGGSGYLGFDKLSGSGTLIKRGTAALGLMGDMDQPTSNLTVRLEQGGLVLRKNNLEPLSVIGARSDWAFTPEGKWGDNGTLQFCTYVVNSTGTATTSRRVRVKEPWTVTYSFMSSASADAYSFFLHNDPRGPSAVGGATTGAGYNGITPSIGLRWCFYPGHAASVSNKVTIGRAGNWDENKNVSYLPVVLLNGWTGCTIKYDPVAATLTAVLTQGVYGVTNVFTGVNVPTDVGSDYAYLGFGGGCGGATAEMRVRDFTMTYDSPLTDTLPSQTYLASLTLPAASTNTVTLDTSIASGSFKIAAATVGSGATLGLAAAVQPGTLAIGAVTQLGDASYPVAAGCTLAVSNVVGGAALTKSGSGTLALSGTVATYTGVTRLTAGTLSLPAALMPSATDLYVTSGAFLNLAFTGRQYVHMLTVNGVMMHGGTYTSANASWITGPGTLVVTYPPVGTTITVK